MASHTSSLWYVYGIVPSDSLPASPPAGLDDVAVVVEAHDGVAALVSLLDGINYAPLQLESNSGDVEWLSPRAVAHDRVLTWASDRSAVVPLPMFSLFSGRDAVQTMLRDRRRQLERTLTHVGSAREYALRVYRIDAELLEVIPTLSPRLAELAKAAASASPGQRYLLERKLDGEKRSEVRGVTLGIVDQIIDALTPTAREVVRSPIPRAEGDASRGTMVLNAAFLVSPKQLGDYQRILTGLVQRYGVDGGGFRFDFTGPWPPYHFVNERRDDE